VLQRHKWIGTRTSTGFGALDALVWSFRRWGHATIFFGGELKAAQDLRTAEQKRGRGLRGTALRAFQEVEDALAGDYYLRKREGALAP